MHGQPCKTVSLMADQEISNKGGRRKEEVINKGLIIHPDTSNNLVFHQLEDFNKLLIIRIYYFVHKSA